MRWCSTATRAIRTGLQQRERLLSFESNSRIIQVSASSSAEDTSPERIMHRTQNFPHRCCQFKNQIRPAAGLIRLSNRILASTYPESLRNPSIDTPRLVCRLKIAPDPFLQFVYIALVRVDRAKDKLRLVAIYKIADRVAMVDCIQPADFPSCNTSPPLTCPDRLHSGSRTEVVKLRLSKCITRRWPSLVRRV